MRTYLILLLATACAYDPALDDEIETKEAPLGTCLTTGTVDTYLPFSGSARDKGRWCNDGTVSGATLAPDRYGVADHAYALDGVDDRITLANENNFDSQRFTIGFWMKPTGVPIYPIHYPTGCPTVYMVQKATGNAPDYYGPFTVGLQHCGGDSYYRLIAFKQSTATATSSLYFFTNILVNQWRHVAVTSDGAVVRLYLDGVEVASQANPQPLGNNAPVVLGAAAHPDADFVRNFPGELDDFRYRGDVMTPDQIAQLAAM